MAHLRVAHFADFEVAHAYFGKDARARLAAPPATTQQLVHELQAELVELVAQQQIEHKQLTLAVAFFFVCFKNKNGLDS